MHNLKKGSYQFGIESQMTLQNKNETFFLVPVRHMLRQTLIKINFSLIESTALNVRSDSIRYFIVVEW